ncbi:hypothetical protein GGI42DRAFT_337496 [Trichoderma sp. SZMC 28013]
MISARLRLESLERFQPTVLTISLTLFLGLNILLRRLCGAMLIADLIHWVVKSRSSAYLVTMGSGSSGSLPFIMTMMLNMSIAVYLEG